MDSDQLSRIMTSDECLRDGNWGIFMRDTLPNVLRPGGYIVNSDVSSGSGQHWLALWITENEPAEFVDSFGRGPGYYKLTIPSPVVTNRRQLQSDDAVSCGAYCVYFLFHRCRGLSMKDILNSFGKDTRANDSLVTKFVNMLYNCRSR